MKVTLLLNGCNKQESLMSESVMVIRINLEPCKGNHMTHVSHEDTKSGNSSRRGQRDDPGPPHPSARIPHDTSTGIRGWPTQYGRIAFVLVTNKATKFMGLHKSCMHHYIIEFAH
jgi:hypothetical protein